MAGKAAKARRQQAEAHLEHAQQRQPLQQQRDLELIVQRDAQLACKQEQLGR
jgi:hypothetical protein